MDAVNLDIEGLQVPVVLRFRGEFFFLSNFFPAVTPHRGRRFPTSEHAFAAAKTDDSDVIAAICAATDPAEAKAIGRNAPLVDGWEVQRFVAMEEIITSKFNESHDLADKLIATDGMLLVEGNSWHDQTWGSCTCTEHHLVPGANALGVILMSVRMKLAAPRRKASGK